MTRASALLAALLLASLLVGCSGAVDQAHSLQTQLNRIDGINDAQVTTPSPSTGAAIELVYGGDPNVGDLRTLVKEVDAAAVDENYPSYRLDLIPAQHDADRLTVDDSFTGSASERQVLQNWLDTTSILLGDVHYTAEPGSERISVDADADAGVLHDVGEVSRIGYGTAATEWTFVDGTDTFVVSGKVTAADVVLFQDVQSSVSSDVLTAPADSWRLQRGARQVLLDLVVTLPGAPVAPEQVTIARYGADVERLATAALAATDSTALPVTIRIVNRTDDGDDVFAMWSSEQRPVRGRDPYFRGWDPWLERLAG